MATASWQKAKDQVASWLDNEQQCVTAQRISQSLSVTRTEGSRMLEEILQDKKKSLQITTCHQEETSQQQDENHNNVTTTGKIEKLSL
jgi:PAB1-binding protein PBP1